MEEPSESGNGHHAPANDLARPRKSSRTTTPRGTLNRGRILEAVARTVAKKGVDAVTMRGIATELRVDPMALYRHFSDKDALLAAFVDDVFATIEAPQQTGLEGVKELARQYFRILVDNPGLVSIDFGNSIRSPHHLLLGERLYKNMLDAGYEVETAVMLFGGLQRLVFGSALVFRRRSNDQAEYNRARETFRELDPEEFPMLRLVNEHVPRLSQEEVFDRWLDLIFDPSRLP